MLLPEMAGAGSRMSGIIGQAITYNWSGYSTTFAFKGYSSDWYDFSGNKIESNIHKISNISVNGIETNICWNVDYENGNRSSSGYKLRIILYDDDKVLVGDLTIYNGNIYLAQLNEGYTIEIFYLE